MYRLKELREQRGLNQYEIANLIGVSAQAYGKYEKATRGIDVQKLITIANFYGVTLGYLVGEEDAPKQTDTPERKEKNLSTRERELLDLFNKLDYGKQERLLGMASILAMSVPADEYRKEA